MSAPLPVAVVRPKRSADDLAVTFFSGIALTLVVAWVLMLIAGTVTEWGLGYWHTLVALVGIRLLQTSPSWKAWTHKAPGSAV